MTYRQAFDLALSAAKEYKRTFYLMHDPAQSDAGESESYEVADETARAYLFPHARLVLKFEPANTGAPLPE